MAVIRYQESVRGGGLEVGENELVVLEAAGDDPPGIFESQGRSCPRPRLAVFGRIPIGAVHLHCVA